MRGDDASALTQQIAGFKQSISTLRDLNTALQQKVTLCVCEASASQQHVQIHTHRQTDTNTLTHNSLHTHRPTDRQTDRHTHTHSLSLIAIILCQAERAEALEAEVATIREEAAQSKEGKAQAEAQCTELEAKLEQETKRITEELSSKMAAMASKHKAKVEQLQTKAATLATQVREVTAARDEATRAKDAAEQNRLVHSATAFKKQQELQQKLDEATKALEDKAAALSASHQEAEQQKQQLAEFQDLLEEKDTAALQLEEQVSELVMHVQEQKRQIESLEMTLERVLQRLDEAVEKGAVAPLNPREIMLYGARPDGPAKLSVTIPAVNVVQPPGGGGEHHVYQIYITVGREQWVIYRRYSQLLEFHRDISRHLEGVQDIAFPPKVTLGSRTPKVAEERRVALQAYLQAVVRLARKTRGTPLQQELSKQALLLTLPFLAEETSSLSPVKGFASVE